MTMCGFKQACGNVCDIAQGIQISLSINIPMPNGHKPTRLGGDPCPIEDNKDYRGPNNGTDESQNGNKNPQDDMSFMKCDDKLNKKDEESKYECWN